MLTKEVCLVQKMKVHIIIKLFKFFLLFFHVLGKVGVVARTGQLVGVASTAGACPPVPVLQTRLLVLTSSRAFANKPA